MSGIFISYRRSVSRDLARLIFGELRSRGHDVFLDVNTIDSGQFDRIILNQIAARPHFLLILKSGSLQRCANPGDWLRREIEEALRLKRNIVPVYDEGFNIEDEKQYLPEALRAELSRLNAPPYSHYYFEAFIETLTSRFLKMPDYNIPLTPTPPTERVEVQQRIDRAAAEQPDKPHITSAEESSRKRAEIASQLESHFRGILINTPSGPTPLPQPPDLSNILPPPFEWISIPAGKVILEAGGYVPEDGQTFEVPAFYIAKYPVTNTQYAKFIDAEGYANRQWWTDAGWQEKEKERWTKPRWWQDEKWNADYPVVGVSWYEAVVFCNWLNAATGTASMQIALPTEQQWQRAAQGDDGRDYPWGNQWDANRCNTEESKIGRTTPVRQYEGKGDSPYGVVDMAGNVWEWCLTNWKNGSADPSGNAKRVLRGGAFYDSQNFAGCMYRHNFVPDLRGYYHSIRLVYAAPVS